MKVSKNFNYLNWAESDLSTIDETEFFHFENFCDEMHPNTPMLVNRYNFQEHMEEILSQIDNVNVLVNFNKKTKSLYKEQSLSYIRQSFYFERDVNHWMLKFDHGELSQAVFVIDAFEMKLHPFEDYENIAWEDFAKAHLLKHAELARQEELRELRATAPKWTDDKLKDYWELYKDDTDYLDHIAIIRAERRKRAGID
jgi:hypothetical protein